MNTTLALNAEATAPNIVQLTITPKPRSEPREAQWRFSIKEFLNASGTKSWRVAGYKRDGARVRENFAEQLKAEARRIELETEYLQGEAKTEIQATKLTRDQISLAESAFIRLGPGHDAELTLAVERWLNGGRESAVTESARLDDALAKFKEWLDAPDCTLRKRSKENLKKRVGILAGSIPNMRIADITKDVLEGFLDKRKVAVRTRINDRLALSRFFKFCIKKKWATVNPCREIEIKATRPDPPILTVKDCKKLLATAQRFEGGIMAPYVAVCLFGGLRPTEAARLTWDRVNLKDGEIRVDGDSSKTKRGRVVKIGETLRAWLKAYDKKAFRPSNFDKDFRAMRRAAGFGGPRETDKKLKAWPEDVMRHTAVSHFFRQTGSYGQTAEQFGNSEQIIKRHYQGIVTSEDTKKFYALLPKKGGRK